MPFVVDEPDRVRQEELLIGLEDVGSQILEIISKGLYSDPMMIVRELIQNAVDARPETSIDIRTGSEDLYIIDDGEGMDYKGLVDAKKIAVSFKDPRFNVGFRGIGLWSTLAVAEELRIFTSKRDERYNYRLTVKLGEILADVNPQRSLKEVLAGRIILATIEKEDIGDHGTIVHLRGIRPEVREKMLDTTAISRFIERNLPVRFPKEFDYATEITKLLADNIPGFRQFNVTLNGTSMFKRIPRDRRGDQPIKLDQPMYSFIRSDDGSALAWYWMCRNKVNRKIGDPDARGLVYRRHNFAIGDSNTTLPLFVDSEHLRGWFFGEIHLLHDDLIPNSAREDIEPSHTRNVFVDKTKRELKNKTLDVRDRSARTNADEKLKRARGTLDKIAAKVRSVKSEEEAYLARKDLSDLMEVIRSQIEPKVRKKTGKPGAAASEEWMEAGERMIEEIGILLDKLTQILELLRKEEAGEAVGTSRGKKGEEPEQPRTKTIFTEREKKLRHIVARVGDESRPQVLRRLLLSLLGHLQRLARDNSDAAALLDDFIREV